MSKITRSPKKGRKPVVYADGITIYQNSKGFGVRIAENGNVLADMGGYNSVRNLNKGLDALYDRLRKSQNTGEGTRWLLHKHPDMIKKAKSAVKKAASKK